MDLRPRFRFLPLPLAAALLASALPLAADRVVLKNGQTFEDVIATETGEQVRIRLSSGELRLSKAQIATVERLETPFETFLTRRTALEADAATPARAFVELARWAAGKGLRREAREVALSAAAIDPRAEGLAALLASHGYVFDPDLGRYLSEGEFLSRRGYVQHRGEWVSRAEQRTRLEEERAAAEARRREHLAAVARRAEIEERVIAARSRPSAPPAVVVVAPIAYFPAPFVIVPSFPTPGSTPPVIDGRQGQPRPNQGFVLDALERAPGSLIPGVLDLGPG